MQNSFQYNFFKSKMILFVLFLFCVQFSAFSAQSKSNSKTLNKNTFVVSKKTISKKIIVIKTNENTQYESELIIELNETDFDFFSLNKNIKPVNLIESVFLTVFKYDLNFIFFQPDLSSPPPKA